MIETLILHLYSPIRHNKMTTKTRYTNEDLKAMLAKEIEKVGPHVWTDRRKTLEEMLKMRGVK